MGVLPLRAQETGLTLQTAAPMFAAGPGFEIVLWNDAAEALLAFTRSEVLGRRCFDVLGCPDPTRRLCCQDPGHRPGGERVPGFESQVSTGSGERIWVDVTTLLAAAGDGPPVRLHLLRETRRQRQLEELLREVVSAASKLSPRAGNGAGAAPPVRGVTRREREVVRLLAQGSSTVEIAARLGMAPRTARNHIQNILGKLRAHSRLEAVARATARGLV